MAFFPWRERAIFRVSEAPLDPDEIKIRFRRKILRAAIFVGIMILSIPLIQKKVAGFRADREIRYFARVLLQARTRASKERAPVALEIMHDRRGWNIFELPNHSDCSAMVPPHSKTSSHLLGIEGMFWRPLFLSEKETSGIGAPVTRICFDPNHGVILDSKPLDSGWFYIVLRPQDEAAISQNSLHQVILTRAGSELMISKQN